MCRVVCFIAFRCSQLSNICVNSCESLSCCQLLQNWKRPRSFVLDWAESSPRGNWFCSGLQVFQNLQTDLIMMTSSLGAYCSGHPISYRAECITISGFFVWSWLWLWCHLGTDSVERHCKTSLSAGTFSCYYAASIFDVLSVWFFANLLHNHIVTIS